jgi:hypothetical protein
VVYDREVSSTERERRMRPVTRTLSVMLLTWVCWGVLASDLFRINWPAEDDPLAHACGELGIVTLPLFFGCVLGLVVLPVQMGRVLADARRRVQARR